MGKNGHQHQPRAGASHPARSRRVPKRLGTRGVQRLRRAVALFGAALYLSLGVVLAALTIADKFVH